MITLEDYTSFIRIDISDDKKISARYATPNDILECRGVVDDFSYLIQQVANPKVGACSFIYGEDESDLRSLLHGLECGKALSNATQYEDYELTEDQNSELYNAILALPCEQRQQLEHEHIEKIKQLSRHVYTVGGDDFHQEITVEDKKYYWLNAVDLKIDLQYEPFVYYVAHGYEVETNEEVEIIWHVYASWEFRSFDTKTNTMNWSHPAIVYVI